MKESVATMLRSRLKIAACTGSPSRPFTVSPGDSDADLSVSDETSRLSAAGNYRHKQQYLPDFIR